MYQVSAIQKERSLKPGPSIVTSVTEQPKETDKNKSSTTEDVEDVDWLDGELVLVI